MILFTFKNVLSLIKPLGKSIPKAVMLLGAITLLCSSITYAQGPTRRVTGIVTDINSGETLIGATVAIKGRTNVTQVDVAGKFAIDVPANSVLVVRYIGYTDLEVPVEDKITLDVKLSKVTTNLEEVVVTGFGLTTKKATLAGAISQLSGEDLSASKATSVSGALVGKVAGVNFRQNNGRPGSSPAIRVRNFGSSPLVVIDGVTRSVDTYNAQGVLQRDNSAFDNLDFNDVESLNVLKDGSAAIYGMNADNGVIVVTTKKGKRGQKPTISLDSYYGVQQIANFNKPADIKSYIKGIVQTETYGNGSVSSTRSITPAEYDKWMAGTEPGYEGFDWYKYIYKDAPQSQVRVSVSGGSDNADYFVSGTTTNQGVALRDFGDGFKRHNIQSNINANISKRVRFGVSINGYWSKESSTNVPGDNFDFAAETAYRNLPDRGPYANGNPLYPQNSSAADFTYSYGLINPTLSGTESTTRRNIQLNGNLEVDILTGLKARMLANYSYLNRQFDSRRLSNTVYRYDAATSTYLVDQFNESRTLDHVYQNTDNTTLQFQLEYRKSFGKHNLHVNAGVENRLEYSPQIRVAGIPPANNIPFVPGVAYVTDINDDISLYTPRQGYIARVNYDYAGKYIVEGYGRYDGSPDYKPTQRWGMFPGGSVAYRISQESFWKKSGILSKIDDFKIRASYGILGFRTNGNFRTGYDYDQGFAVLNGQIVTGAQARGLPSDYVTWGRTYSSDVGIDMTLLNNRLSITLDYFNRTRTGIVAPTGVFIPNLTGYTIGGENINTDKNRGVDGSVSWRDRVGEVTYNVGANFSYGREIVGFRYNQLFPSDLHRWRGLSSFNLALPQTSYGVDRLQGGPFQYISIGQFQSWEQIANHPVDQDGRGNATQKPGDFIFQDTNGDGFVNYLDQQRTAYTVNNNTPILAFGFNFGASYKGFDIRADFSGGSMFTFEQGGFMRFWDPNKNTSQYLMDNSSYYSNIWDRNSPIIVGKFPLLLQTAPAPNTDFGHTGWQTNITYLRLRTLTIGYTIPYSIMKPLGISNFKIYVSGQNVLTFSNMPNNLDPEIQSNGGNAYPNPRVLTAGVQVKF